MGREIFFTETLYIPSVILQLFSLQPRSCSSLFPKDKNFFTNFSVFPFLLLRTFHPFFSKQISAHFVQRDTLFRLKNAIKMEFMAVEFCREREINERKFNLNSDGGEGERARTQTILLCFQCNFSFTFFSRYTICEFNLNIWRSIELKKFCQFSSWIAQIGECFKHFQLFTRPKMRS